MLLGVHDFISCLFLSVFQSQTNLAAAWGQNHEFGKHSQAGGDCRVPGEGTRTTEYFGGWRTPGRRRGRLGSPKVHPQPLVRCYRDVLSQLGISQGKRQPRPHYPSSSLAGRAQAPPTTSGRPSVPANPLEAWARKAVLPWSEVTSGAWLAAESAETLGGG